MSTPPSSPPRKVWITALASLATMGGSALAQNFSLGVADSNPLGIGNFVPSAADLDLGLEGTIKGDFDYGLAASTFYDTNFFLTDKDEEDELYASFDPWVRYDSDPEGGAKVTVTANYTPVIRCYLDNSDLNGIDQTGDVTLTFKGLKTEVSVFGRYNELSATDRLTGDFVEGSLLTGGVRGVRQIAPRTSLSAGWTGAMSDYGSSANEGAEVYTSYFGGSWQASERLGFGPTIRYTASESDNTGSRDAWAMLLDARYKVGERIWISASVGPEYSQTSDGIVDDSNIGMTGDITATYIIDERWRWLNKIRSATIPSPSDTNYMVNDVTISTMLQRQLLRSSISGGLDLSLSEYEDVGTAAAVTRGNEQNLSVFLAYNRPLFSERVGFNSMVRYSFNEGKTDWSQFLMSAGLNVVF